MTVDQVSELNLPYSFLLFTALFVCAKTYSVIVYNVLKYTGNSKMVKMTLFFSFSVFSLKVVYPGFIWKGDICSLHLRAQFWRMAGKKLAAPSKRYTLHLLLHVFLSTWGRCPAHMHKHACLICMHKYTCTTRHACTLLSMTRVKVKDEPVISSFN